MNAVKNALRRRREQAELSRQALATAAGLSISTLANYEAGYRVSNQAAQKLARVLGCAPADLLDGDR